MVRGGEKSQNNEHEWEFITRKEKQSIILFRMVLGENIATCQLIVENLQFLHHD